MCECVSVYVLSTEYLVQFVYIRHIMHKAQVSTVPDNARTPVTPEFDANLDILLFSLLLLEFFSSSEMGSPFSYAAIDECFQGQKRRLSNSLRHPCMYVMYCMC